MRAIVVDALARAMVDLLCVQGPDLIRAFASVNEDWEAATEEERLRALPFIFATYKLFENAWFQRQQVTLSDEQWQGWDAYIRTYFHRPGIKTWWSSDIPPSLPAFENTWKERNRSRR